MEGPSELAIQLYDYHTIIPIARQVKSGECKDFCRLLVSMDKALPDKDLRRIPQPCAREEIPGTFSSPSVDSMNHIAALTGGTICLSGSGK
jgi:hypothetical protein